MRDKIQKIAAKISGQRHLLAIRDGMAAAMPLIIIGSLFMLIANFPAEQVTNWLASVGLVEFLNKVSDSTFGIIGLVVTFSISYNLARRYKVDGVSTGFLSISALIFLTPLLQTDEGAGFPTRYLGTSGMFVGIIVSLITTEIFRAVVEKDLVIKMPDTVPPNVSKSFSAIIPGLIVMTFWLVMALILRQAGVDNIHMLVQNVIGKPLSLLTGTLGGIIVVILTQCFFWFFGIHGAQLTGPIIEPLLFANSDANRLAMQAGKELPNIITYEYLYNFVFPGGAGAVIALALLLFFFSKSESNKSLGKLSIVPVSFQIAEPVLFGYPTIMNPKIIVPFVLSPVVNAIMVYYAMKFGWVAKPVGAVVPWTTPPVIAGYLATGGKISGAVMNIVTIIVDMLIYYPFFKADDNEKLRVEQQSVKEN